jgi:hypothetical protein
MCGGVLCVGADGMDQRVYFPNPAARLPVRTKNGMVHWVAWGRRDTQSGRLPKGGWARLDSIAQGKWRVHMPQPVKLMVQGFMEKDAAGVSHWYAVQANQCIQALLAYDDGGLARVYVVTVAAKDARHCRWPRVV